MVILRPVRLYIIRNGHFDNCARPIQEFLKRRNWSRTPRDVLSASGRHFAPEAVICRPVDKRGVNDENEY